MVKIVLHIKVRLLIQEYDVKSMIKYSCMNQKHTEIDLAPFTIAFYKGGIEMLKKEFTVGASSFVHSQTQKEIPITLRMIVYDVAAQDWVDKIHPHTGTVPPRPMTIGEFKQLWGGKLQGPLSHPLGKGQRFQFDITPWSHLPDNTYLNIEWPFEAIHAGHLQQTGK